MSISVASPAPSSRRTAGASVGIPPRQVDFPLPDSSPRYFYDNNPFATLFFAMLSGIFPPGERYFMDSVKHFRHRIKDKTLQAQIAGFIGQEALHGREHDRLNTFFTSRGIETRYAEEAIKVGLNLLKKVSPSQQLACTTFMEHFTALLGEQLLKDERFRADADPQMLHLWLWHALEELEHKAVAYDVYEQIGNRRLERILAIPLVAGALLPAIGYSMAMMMITDGQLFNMKENRKGLRLLFAPKTGFISRFIPKVFDFARKDFHPDQHDTEALVAEWKVRLFGENGELNAWTRNLDAIH